MKRRGFTLIETLVAIAVLGIFFAAVVGILKVILDNTTLARVKAVALAIAGEKIEAISNLSYANVGTVGGIPAGSIEQKEEIVINSQKFIVETRVIYVDDPFDGMAPSDVASNDYKMVQVSVSWENNRMPVTLVTNIAPKKIEEGYGGVLSIQVFNSNGVAASGATVKIDNTVVTPPIHIQLTADEGGKVNLPGASVCVECYRIEVTKNGYSIDRTYSNLEVANPVKPYSSVALGKVTNVSFAIDKLSSVVIKSYGSRSYNYPPIGGVTFTLRSQKIIGYDVNGDPVYKYEYSTNTGGGSVSIPDLEWGSYELDFSQSGYNLAGINPLTPILLEAGASQTVLASLVVKTSNSLLVVVQDASGLMLASASATLIDANQVVATNSMGLAEKPDFGQTLFGGLDPGDYSLKVALSGYEDAVSAVAVSGETQERIKLNPI